MLFFLWSFGKFFMARWIEMCSAETFTMKWIFKKKEHNYFNFLYVDMTFPILVTFVFSIDMSSSDFIGNKQSHNNIFVYGSISQNNPWEISSNGMNKNQRMTFYLKISCCMASLEMFCWNKRLKSLWKTKHLFKNVQFSNENRTFECSITIFFLHCSKQNNETKEMLYGKSFYGF